jgi:ABC-type transporter Mla MlaB component
MTAEAEHKVAVLAVGEVHDSGDVSAACRAAVALLNRTGARILECDAAGITRPDLLTVELLARLKLTSVRSGRIFRVRNAPTRLVKLLHFAGLEEVLDVKAAQV